MTLHIRVTSPPGSIDTLVRVVAAMAGVANLVVLPEARLPSGDAIQFDVAPSAANAVFARLRELEPHLHGPIAVHSVDAVIGTPSSSRPPRLLSRDLPPIWDLVEARIRADAVYAPSFYLLLLLAGLIAATGILTNSQILIVGAMVVGPEYSAIMGVALGLDQRDRPTITTGLLALLAGFGAAITTCLLFGLCIRGLGHTPHLYATGVRPVSDLINSPNFFSVVVAVVAGVVGVVSLTQARAGALIGVFISVTTIPAAADIGLSLAYGSWPEAGGSTLQLLLNVVLLIMVGAGGLRLQRRLWPGGDTRTAGRTRPLPPLAPRRLAGLRRRIGCEILAGLSLLPGTGRLARRGQTAPVVGGVHHVEIAPQVGALAPQIPHEGRPPRHHRAEPVAESGQEPQVNEQPGDPSRHTAETDRASRHDGVPA